MTQKKNDSQTETDRQTERKTKVDRRDREEAGNIRCKELGVIPLRENTVMLATRKIGKLVEHGNNTLLK